MSTVIGSCTDCIVSLPSVPINTLNGKLGINSGRGAVLRALRNVNFSFDASNGLVVQDLVLQPQQTFSLYTGAAGFILAPKAPLSVVTAYQTGSPPSTNTNAFTVNSILLLDSPVIGASITNPNPTNGAPIDAFLAYVPSASGTSGTNGSFVSFEQTAVAAQTIFDVTYAPGSLMVFQNGVLLQLSDYVATDGATVVLVQAANAGDQFLFVTSS
jgi:hypothetical protein